ncbi:MAG: prepilin-type N-terminal cleavage/methylation domain-containing protein [Xanthomonadaceae bacterium]|nr:prepilin-type N-terminal cleavage/methylation domain-containing protein [Xanthomonadaceae bacterium]MDE2309006.1 prepilin-type N-terminal cleavage/methylation domain-containing protein [Xanthomonadaceae bacterium]
MHRRSPGGSGMPRSGPVGTPRRGRGFTLVELMITMAVAVVLIMIAVPSFRSMTLSNKLTTAANDMVGAINIARMEAIKSNSNTQLCSDSSASNTSNTLGNACNASPQAGAVYALTNGAATQVRAASVGITTPLKLNGSITALRFGGQGLGQAVGTTTPYTGTVADICTGSISTGNHRLIQMTAGSIVAVTTTTGSCP